MAIINVTPDSFWRDSRASAESALSAAMRAVEDGADILDIGAQSTRPGYAEVSAEEELARLEVPLAAILKECPLPPLAAILKECPLPVSVDTYFPRVADAALEMGAHMINDVWGLTRPGMAQTIAAHGAAACIMHNSPVPVTGDVFGEVKSFLSAQVKSALDAGIPADAICLDGGIGFAKECGCSTAMPASNRWATRCSWAAAASRCSAEGWRTGCRPRSPPRAWRPARAYCSCACTTSRAMQRR